MTGEVKRTKKSIVTRGDDEAQRERGVEPKWGDVVDRIERKNP